MSFDKRPSLVPRRSFYFLDRCSNVFYRSVRQPTILMDFNDFNSMLPRTLTLLPSIKQNDLLPARSCSQTTFFANVESEIQLVISTNIVLIGFAVCFQNGIDFIRMTLDWHRYTPFASIDNWLFAVTKHRTNHVLNFPVGLLRQSPSPSLQIYRAHWVHARCVSAI